MIFDDLKLVDTVEVDILNNPYKAIMRLFGSNKGDIEAYAGYLDDVEVNIDNNKKLHRKERLCLPLYSIKNNEKYVAKKSGLNQWNASGRNRHANELYIPYQKKDRDRNESFFPPRNTSFKLHLPDGREISAKVCQTADKNNSNIGKAIMSNPNKELGKWLLRDVFELEENTLVTYEMLEKFGIDSVVFTKNDNLDYSIDFAEIGTYEEFYNKD
jgi:hypothetical protein